MNKTLKKMLVNLVGIEIFAFLIQWVFRDKSNTIEKDRFLLLTVFILIVIIQVICLVIYTRYENQILESLKAILLIYGSSALGSIYLHSINTSVILLILPLIYCMSGKLVDKEGNPYVPDANQTIVLFLCTIIGYFFRPINQLGFARLKYNFFSEAVIFICCIMQIIYLFGDLKEKNIKLKNKIEATKENAAKDGLTGLLNRSGLNKAIEEEMEKLSTFCVLMLDIDNFKSVNDTYGHVFGDEVLKNLANVLSSCTGKKDKVFRYGGEEFLVLLPKSEIKDALVVAEKIRKTFSEIRYEHIDDGEKTFTVSIGAEDCKYKKYKSIQKLIEDCDSALYEAKNTGKNRVVYNLNC